MIDHLICYSLSFLRSAEESQFHFCHHGLNPQLPALYKNDSIVEHMIFSYKLFGCLLSVVMGRYSNVNKKRLKKMAAML